MATEQCVNTNLINTQALEYADRNDQSPAKFSVPTDQIGPSGKAAKPRIMSSGGNPAELVKLGLF